MKRLLTFALSLLGFVSAPLADSLRLEGLHGVVYQPSTNIETVWAATNDPPSTLWVYKVMPQTFSMAVISNAVSVCGFNWNQISKKPISYIDDKNVFSFADKPVQWTRRLVIAPTLGYMEYNGDSGLHQVTNGVPTRKEAEQLGMEYLHQLGIDCNLVSNNHSGMEGVRGKLSKDGERLTTNVISRGVSFTRKIDGYASRIPSALMMDFENYATIHRLVLSWRNLIPYELCHALSKDELLQLIKDGQGNIPLQSGDMSQIDKASKLTVTEITIRYFDNIGSKPLDISYPFAAVKLSANLGGTNTATFYLECPILSTNVFSVKN